jgi:hypothetical protein
VPTTHDLTPTAPSRRRLLQTLALLAGQSTLACNQAAPQHKFSIEILHGVSRVNGTRLADDRLETIQSNVEQNLAEIKAIRQFDLDERTEPATVFLAKL